LYSALYESAYQLEVGHLFFENGSPLSDLLHQRLCDCYFFVTQFMHPRHPGLQGVGGTEFFKPEVLASGGLIPSIEPSCPLARVVLGHPQYEILDVGAHRAVETIGLIVKRVPDSKNSLPQRPMRFDP
jgi:hypothetical protein